MRSSAGPTMATVPPPLSIGDDIASNYACAQEPHLDPAGWPAISLMRGGSGRCKDRHQSLANKLIKIYFYQQTSDGGLIFVVLGVQLSQKLPALGWRWILLHLSLQNENCVLHLPLTEKLQRQFQTNRLWMQNRHREIFVFLFLILWKMFFAGLNTLIWIFS